MAESDSKNDLEKRIIKQIEYYFGDINLPRDRFMQEEIKKDEGWISLETMLKFKRLRDISEDKQVITAAVKKSDLMQVSEDDSKIRRSPNKPIPENTAERREDINSRTLYVKGFPLDITLDDLTEFFEKYGEVDSIFRRTDVRRKFKGSVFITYHNVDMCKKFLEIEGLKYKEVDLVRKFRSDYHKEKTEEARRRKEQKGQKREKKEKNDEQEEEDEKKDEVVRGTLIFMKGLTNETTREDIKNLLQDHGTIAWVDFNKGDTQGYVRYHEEGQAQQVLDAVNKAMEKKIMLNGNQIECSVLEGEEEEIQWKKMLQQNRDARNKKHRGGNRGGRFQGSKKFGSRASKNTRNKFKAEAAQDDGPSAKKMKVEAD